MSVINLKCIDQVLTIVDSPVISSGNVNYDTVNFDFCDSWGGFTKTAIFYRTEDEAYYQILDENNNCVIPKEVLRDPGIMYLGVFGTSGDVVLTSEVLAYKITKGAITEDLTPPDPTPDIYAQLIALYNETLQFVENKEDKLTDSASGKFITIDPSVKGTALLVDLAHNGSYEVEICGKQNFDGVSILNAHIDKTIKANDNARLVYSKCAPNTTYTVSKVASTKFRVGYTTDIPSVGMSVNNILVKETASAITITTGSDAKYLVAFVYNSQTDTLTEAEIIGSIQIEVGAVATEREDFRGATVHITNDMEIAYIPTYDGVTNISAPTTLNVRYALTESGIDVLKGANAYDDVDSLLTDTVKSEFVHLEGTFDGVAKVDGVVKNLLPYPYANITQTNNGVTATVNDDGTILVSGTATADTYLPLSSGYVIPNESCCMRCNSDNSNIGFYVGSNIVYGNDTTIIKVSDYGTSSTFGLFVKNGSAVNTTVKPMITKGTTPQSYVPYTYEVVSCGKNRLTYPYLDTTKTVSGITWSDNGDGTISVNGTATANTRFAIMSQTLNDYSGLLLSGGISANRRLIIQLAVSPWTEFARSTGNGVAIGDYSGLPINVFLEILAGETVTNVTFKPQIESGTIATDFEPYVENTAIITGNTEEAFVNTYDGETNIFTEYGVPLEVTYGLTPNGSQIYAGAKANMEIESLKALVNQLQTAILSLGGNV